MLFSDVCNGLIGLHGEKMFFENSQLKKVQYCVFGKNKFFFSNYIIYKCCEDKKNVNVKKYKFIPGKTERKYNKNH